MNDRSEDEHLATLGTDRVAKPGPISTTPRLTTGYANKKRDSRGNLLNISLIRKKSQKNHLESDHSSDVPSQEEHKDQSELSPEQDNPVEFSTRTRSRIETYDEFARFRNSSRPPDSHYPPGPTYRRSNGIYLTTTNFIIIFPAYLKCIS
ncbi:unnamed protein product [Colias eurytheme]|nr:unnamed protein product [Colias eurytheme]